MRRVWGHLRRALLLCLLAGLILLGDGNEGSVTGSCRCDKIISSSSPPAAKSMDHFRKHLTNYNRCPFYIRFQLRSQSVCGGSQDQWVQELVSCLDRRECGYAHWESLTHQEHLPPCNTLIPEPTEGAPPHTSSSAQISHIQQPTLPPGAPSSDKDLTHLSETTTPTAGYSLGAGPEPETAGVNQKQLEEKAGAAAGTSAMVPVLSLLAIVFILTAVLLYVLCRRRKEQPWQYSPAFPDLQPHYTPVTSDPRTEA